MGLSVSEGSSLGSSDGSSLKEADAVGFGAASSSEAELASAKIARSTTPAITKKRTLEEFFFAGVVEVVTGFAATDVVFEVEVSPREGTGGITIFAASTPAGRFGRAFLIGRLAEDFFTADFFLLAAFLLAAFLLADFLLADFLLAAFLLATFFTTTFWWQLSW